MAWKLYEGDCLEIMPLEIEDNSIDMILCDLPYGTTACKWDTIIPFKPLWREYERIIKDNGAIVLTASQPFTSVLVMSNPKMFKYEWIWNKTRGSNFQNANHQPMKSHENILIFSRNSTKYNPQFWYDKPYKTKERKRNKGIEGLSGGSASNYCTSTVSEDGKRYPLSIIEYKRDGDRMHPTQKPVKLFEYLIKTYTNEGDLVLDNCAGSGTTGVACEITNRNSILIEQEPEYCDIIRKRLSEINLDIYNPVKTHKCLDAFY